LFAVPLPKTFSWEELITVMAQAGFSNECKGGSHYTFEHQTGLRVVISKTHPTGILKPYQIKAANSAGINLNEFVTAAIEAMLKTVAVSSAQQTASTQQKPPEPKGRGGLHKVKPV
jgi:predicted RNA binding protein YcfA (HicA-like mRNA interferase family)